MSGSTSARPSPWFITHSSTLRACADLYGKWQIDRNESLAALEKLDPLPRCMALPARIYRDNDINPESPERDLLMISKGWAITHLCLIENCAWADRNIRGFGLIADQCDEMRRSI